MDEQVKQIIVESYNTNKELRDVDTISLLQQKELDKFIEATSHIKNARILDLGAGSGIYAKYFKNQGLDITCIDISPGMVELCLKKNLQAKVMDFYDLKYEDNTYDAIWSMNALLHVPKSNIDVVLSEVKRTLKDNGIFYLGILGGESFEGIYEKDFYKPKRYFSYYTNNELKDLIERYFYIEYFDNVDVGNEHLFYQSIIIRNIP
ncbi:MAG: class I SAM-dependent methyltransferase [Firmicutes bacterium HGW-Firmicutes-7]|nr:MAG: class I SAM-dependent methyltransferase [Firmicutes bacterium HGW-Firmicutes-7]